MPRHQLQSFGGTAVASVFSGAVTPVVTSGVNAVLAGSDVLFASGPGRLAKVLVHQNTALSLSGVAINFYDAPAPVSGGPLSTSGHALLCTVNAPVGLSGQTGFQTGVPLTIDMPFTYGLCYNSRSGQTGVTVSWSTDK